MRRISTLMCSMTLLLAACSREAEQPAPTAPTAEPAPAPAPALPDPRIQTFVDAIRVAGIRSSGAESKVLMNDRVYRVGDTVDLALGIKLEAVAPDSLTFVDAHGASYKKNF